MSVNFLLHPLSDAKPTQSLDSYPGTQPESFNSRLRDECLNINSFYSLLHARVVIGDWKREYNHARPHSSLGYLTPAEYARQCTYQTENDDSHNVWT
ncbi:transposase [Nesterenkonia sp. AN1]|nr:transposase [Nesterenkonia sp. AN1]